MASDLLMLVDGLKGEANDPDWPDAMALNSWSLGAQRNPVSAMGGQRGFSDTHVSDLTVTCGIDQMTTGITAMCVVTKEQPKTVQLIQRRPGGGATGETFLKITLTNTIFTSVQYVSTDAALPAVSISMAYEQIEFEYLPQSTASGQNKGSYSWTWSASATR